MWLIFASLSPVSEAFRNLFSKKASNTGVDPLIISWANNVIPVLLFSLSIFFIDFKFNSQYLIALAATGTLNVAANILYMSAISKGDISKIAPMTSFTPLFLLLTSPIMIGEFPDLSGVIGIILIVAGSYIMNIKLNKEGILAPIKALFTNKGTRLMLITAFIYSITANFDKIAIQNSSVFQHIFLVNAWILACVTILILIRKKKGFQGIEQGRKFLFLVSFSNALISIFHMTALSMALVAYVISLKRTQGIISVILGHFYLKEPDIKYRLPGAVIMFIGVLFIVL